MALIERSVGHRVRVEHTTGEDDVIGLLVGVDEQGVYVDRAFDPRIPETMTARPLPNEELLLIEWSCIQRVHISRESYVVS
jgi:hypothetical protein